MNANSTDADWNSYADAQKNKPLCGTDKPYWSGTACISCPQYYNIITKACDTCPEGEALSSSSHKCEPAQPR